MKSILKKIILSEMMADSEPLWGIDENGENTPLQHLLSFEFEDDQYLILYRYDANVIDLDEILVAKPINGGTMLESVDDESVLDYAIEVIKTQIPANAKRFSGKCLFLAVSVSVIASLVIGMVLQKYIVIQDSTGDLLSSIWSYIKDVHFLGSDWPFSLVIIPVIIVTVFAHEFAHAIVAHSLGDKSIPLAKPWKFLSPIGLIMFFTIGFGVGGRVEMDTKKFKTPKTDIALAAVAGPAVNLLLAAICGMVIFILITADFYPSGYISYALIYGAMVNLGYAGLNMLPLAPLDGEKVLLSFLPNKLYNNLQKSGVYSFVSISLFFLILVFILGVQYAAPFIQ